MPVNLHADFRGYLNNRELGHSWHYINSFFFHFLLPSVDVLTQETHHLALLMSRSLSKNILAIFHISDTDSLALSIVPRATLISQQSKGGVGRLGKEDTRKGEMDTWDCLNTSLATASRFPRSLMEATYSDTALITTSHGGSTNWWALT